MANRRKRDDLNPVRPLESALGANLRGRIFGRPPQSTRFFPRAPISRALRFSGNPKTLRPSSVDSKVAGGGGQLAEKLAAAGRQSMRGFAGFLRGHRLPR